MVVEQSNLNNAPIKSSQPSKQLPNSTNSAYQNLLQQLPSLCNEKKSRYIVDPYTLLRSQTNPNEWYIFEEPKKTEEDTNDDKILGFGGNATVYSATHKIIIDTKNSEISEIVPIDSNNPHKTYAIKKQVLRGDEAETQLEDITRENKYLAGQYVEVRDSIHVPDENVHYTVMENCGVPLNKFLKDFFQQELAGRTFERILSVILGIINAMFLLQRKELVHRDLKLENILVKKINGFYQIFFIDFGITRKEGEKDYPEGTSVYMAPEIAITTPIQREIDMYALAGVFYAILGADPLKDKKTIHQNTGFQEDIQKTPFNDEELFKDLNMAGVDQQLQDDIRAILKDMQDPDPTKRPTLEMLHKFVASIRNRQVALDQVTSGEGPGKIKSHLDIVRELVKNNQSLSVCYEKELSSLSSSTRTAPIVQSVSKASKRDTQTKSKDVAYDLMAHNQNKNKLVKLIKYMFAAAQGVLSTASNSVTNREIVNIQLDFLKEDLLDKLNGAEGLDKEQALEKFRKDYLIPEFGNMVVILASAINCSVKETEKRWRLGMALPYESSNSIAKKNKSSNKSFFGQIFNQLRQIFKDFITPKSKENTDSDLSSQQSKNAIACKNWFANKSDLKLSAFDRSALEIKKDLGMVKKEIANRMFDSEAQKQIQVTVPTRQQPDASKNEVSKNSGFIDRNGNPITKNSEPQTVMLYGSSSSNKQKMPCF